MNLEQALTSINKISQARRGKELTPGERIAVLAAWEKIGYEEAIKLYRENFSPNYISCRAGPGVWKLLSKEFGCRVTKTHLKTVLENMLQDTSLTEQIQANSANPDSVPILFGVPPDTGNFVGYRSQVQHCIRLLRDHRNIFIDGPQGIGKTALAARIVERVMSKTNESIEICIWKSIRYGPLLDELLADLADMLGIPFGTGSSVNKLQNLLIRFFRKHRCLLVLDGAEILQQDQQQSAWDYYSEPYTDYGPFFRRLVNDQGNSSLIVTSRTRFLDWSDLHESGNAAEIIRLEGLAQDDAETIFEEQSLKDRHCWPALINKYHGNPLMLKVIAKRVRTIYGGSTADFLRVQSTIIADPLLLTLNHEFSPSSSMSEFECFAMKILADLMKEHDSVSYEEILQNIESHSLFRSTDGLLRTVSSLVNRSLIEETKVERKSKFRLSSVIRKYIEQDPQGFVGQKVQSVA
ncbi:hypothetical protein C1752_10567 [Acaryochloris thomasi RCC1774]|uniref:Uncharacterized protein n=1 Tax=Acaryochloris thomasi RCC1774 TaxID=1764569 RepID=A0A2W1J892_9CYAN|nr:NACHT domain-containing protein [Acaryochloris thomasi]PZD70560.1 hypothetical protein C1752_10567 [Acaryochloris thomasi RCC1774]